MVILPDEVVKPSIARFLREDRGQAMTEYILIIALITLPLAAVFNAIRSPLRGYLERIVRLFSGPGI